MPTALFGPTFGALLAAVVGTPPCQSTPASAPAPTTGNGSRRRNPRSGSGYLLGENYVNGYAAALDVKHGAGRVVLLGMRPQRRAQPFGNFRILFNAMLYSSDVAATTPSKPGFWKKPEKDSIPARPGG